MNCSIISVGTELLIGQITNTNSVYLSQQLNEIGVSVLYHFTVGDNKNRLEEILEYAMKKSDLIITTGGLGPTQDDLTKETIAMAIGKSLVRHEPSYEKLCNIFKKLNRPMTENNIKQIYLPEDCFILENNCGTAPGFLIENNGKIIVSLPGPPREMSNMFQNHVKGYLQAKTSSVIYSKVLRIFGIGESELESVLIDLISEQNDPTLATYAKEGEVSLRITSKASSKQEASDKISPLIKEIDNRVGKYIYSYDNEELREAVARKLQEKGVAVSLAESCTGGMIASSLTEIPGISKCFDRCYVTYSNSSKMQDLGVQKDTLDKYGAVSEQTAREMVAGLKEKTKSDICIAVTGIAGPDGGSEDKPVGLVYIAMEYNNTVICNRHNIWGNRERVRNYSCLLVLNMIRNVMDNIVLTK